jgi:hypothetical protein
MKTGRKRSPRRQAPLEEIKALLQVVSRHTHLETIKNVPPRWKRRHATPVHGHGSKPTRERKELK